MLLFLLPLLFRHLWWRQLFVLLAYLAGRSCSSTAKRSGDARSVAFEAFHPMPQADISIHKTKSLDRVFN